MGLIKWAVDQAYLQRAMTHIAREHQAFVDTAQVGTTYWSLRPYISAEWNIDPNVEDVHMAFVFVKKDVGRLTTASRLTSWDLWREYGPLTDIPQQTQADIDARNAKRYGPEFARAQAEIQRLFPESYRALVGAGR